MGKKPINPQKILVVDDEPKNVTVLEAKLAPEGYLVETAFNGQEALEKIRTEDPDLVLLDVAMPGMNGYQVCERIRADPSIPYIPIILVTASLLRQRDVIHGLDLGADDYIRKPFDTLELFSRVRAALRVKALNDELSRTKAELSRYVSLSTLRAVEDITSGKGTLSGRTADITILFSDIRRFTNIAENMDPPKVFEMLNRYLSIQIQIIEKHGGIVDKLNGDEVMAVFEGPEMAANALRCAKAITQRLSGVSRGCENDANGVGIGVNSGAVYVGSIGSAGRKDYTVVGNTVNVAARLCGYAQRSQVLFTQNTKSLIKKEDLNYISIGKVTLKGMAKPVDAFQLI